MLNSNIANSSKNVFEILQKLMLSDCNKKSLLKNFSEDSLLIYLNTLKNSGAEIIYPKRNYPFYHLQNNINFLSYSIQDLKLFSKIKNILSESNDYNDIFEYNLFLKNLESFADKTSQENFEKIINAKPFGIEKHPLIKKLEEEIKNKNSLKITYKIAGQKTKDYNILPEYLAVKNRILYLWGADNLLQDKRCLRVDKIIKITHSKTKINKSAKNFNIICEIYNTDKTTLMKNYNLNILHCKTNSITAEFTFNNEFEFLQVLLSFGKDCKIVDNSELKSVFIKKLKEIKDIYE